MLRRLASARIPLRRWLAAGGAAAVLVVLGASAPLRAQAVDSTIVNRARVTFQDANGVSDSASGEVAVRLGAGGSGGGGGGGGGASLLLTKRAVPELAGPGDTLQYTIVLANRGTAAAPAPVFVDTLPDGTGYVAGSLEVSGLGAAPVAGVTPIAGGRFLLRVAGADIAAGDSAVLRYRAVVSSAGAGVLRNRVWLQAGSVADSASTGTNVSVPQVRLVKRVVGADTILPGGLVTFRLAWTNLSAAQSMGAAVLADSLPAGLTFVSADRSPRTGTGSSQSLIWDLGTLRPLQADSLTLVTRVDASLASGTLVNAAVLSGGSTALASARAAVVMRADTATVQLQKQAGVIEAGLGDVVPYVLRVSRASGPIVVHDLLPEGVRLVSGSVQGVDSARVLGRELTLWSSGSGSTPGSERMLRYNVAVVAADHGPVLENRAVAEGPGGVHSDTVVATVRLRLGFDMQSRVVLGKVWLDANGDGRQEANEPGVAGVEVWTEEGQVVRTDSQGRFSFRDLATGTHLLRLDTPGLPRDRRAADRSVVSVRLDGWTTPYVSFRVLPGEAAPADSAAVGVKAAPSNADTTAAAAPAPASPRVTPLRTERERADGEAQAAISGPVIRFLAPADGAVVATNRIYIGLRGEPGAQVRVLDGTREIATSQLRSDGRLDLVAVEIAEGPHRLHALMRNSWGQEVGDSIAVHRVGAPARLELPAGAQTLRAGAQASLPVRVLDRWDVPLAGAVVSVAATGAEVLAGDVDRVSVGLQLAADSAGVLELPLRAGSQVGPGEVALVAGKARGRVGMRVLPALGPLVALGTAQVGVGAAPDAFGALTVRGAVAGDVAVSVSYDSRRSRSRDDAFLRDYDPLEQATYPIFGDASERRVLAGVSRQLAARVERGFDWVQLGDIETRPFGGGQLGLYQRALTGLAARVTTGALTWTGFASPTDQVLAQVQLRGDGTSGPYDLGADLRPGSERIVIETRAPENAARVLGRQELTRYTDYRIDYLTGAVLFEHMVPAADVAGNPIFIVATAERRSGGSTRLVGGGRVDVDAGHLLALRPADSLGVYVSAVHEPGQQLAARGQQDLVGAGAHAKLAGLQLEGEALQAMRPDTTARAGRLAVSSAVAGEKAHLKAEWLQIGRGFGSATDPRLASGMQELSVGGDVRLTDDTRLDLTHERQRFDAFGVQRRNTGARLTQSMGKSSVTADLSASTDAQGGAQPLDYTSLVGKLRFSTPLYELWTDGVRGLDPAVGTAHALARPDQYSVGAALRLWQLGRLEASQRWVNPGDSAHYAVTSLNLRAEQMLGGQVWGGLERTAAERAALSTVLGWSPRLALAGGWTADARFERRFGLSRAPLLDPVRALPFAQAEPDRWSAGAGLQWLPGDSALRMSVRGELHGGTESRGNRVQLGGELPLGSGMALLTRHDWWQDRRATGRGDAWSRRDRSLFGLAFRPTDSDALNVLAKLEWRRDVNPLATGLVQTNGAERRAIGALDAIWSARAGTELDLRYAVRAADGTNAATGGSANGTAHFLGARAQQRLTSDLGVRLDAHLLATGAGSARAGFAPALVSVVAQRLEVMAGYRLGNLRDPDFFDQRENGLFATFSLHLTETVGADVARFWRERINQD